MSDQEKWEKQFKAWAKEVGFEKEPTALEVFQKIMEAREEHNNTLLVDLKKHFKEIEQILQETPAERPNS